MSESLLSLDHLCAVFLSRAHRERFRLLAVHADLKLLVGQSTGAVVLSWVLTLHCRWTTAAKGTTVFYRERGHNGGLDGGSGGLTPRESGSSSQMAKNPPVTPRWESNDGNHSLLCRFCCILTWSQSQTHTLTSFGSHMHNWKVSLSISYTTTVLVSFSLFRNMGIVNKTSKKIINSKDNIQPGRHMSMFRTCRIDCMRVTPLSPLIRSVECQLQFWLITRSHI